MAGWQVRFKERLSHITTYSSYPTSQKWHVHAKIDMFNCQCLKEIDICLLNICGVSSNIVEGSMFECFCHHSDWNVTSFFPILSKYSEYYWASYKSVSLHYSHWVSQTQKYVICILLLLLFNMDDWKVLESLVASQHLRPGDFEPLHELIHIQISLWIWWGRLWCHWLDKAVWLQHGN